MTSDLAVSQNNRAVVKKKGNISNAYFYPCLVFIFFVLGAATNIVWFNIFAIGLFLVFASFLSVKKAVLLLVAMTPNNMIVCLSSNSGFRLIGLFYLIVFIRLYLLRRKQMDKIHKAKNKRMIKTGFLLSFIGILMITLMRVLKSGIHDFALCFQIFIAIMTWILILQGSNKRFRYKIYLYFALGIGLMFIGMLINKLLFGQERFVALLDDPNYTSVAFATLFSTSLFFFSNRFKRKTSTKLLLFSLVGGLMTGSRAFLLSIGLVIFVYFLVGLRNKRIRIVSLLCIGAIIAFVVAYLFKIPFVVKVYDETIGRTLNLRDSYKKGSFMDVTSGRLFLWKYYLAQLFSHPTKIPFGFGFDYYLLENGGYGLVAHNSIISGLMGFGIVGTILVAIAYLHICMMKDRKRSLSLVNFVLVFTVLLAIAVGYFFLDGLLDIRLSMYLSIFVIVKGLARNTITLKRKPQIKTNLKVC